MPEALGLIGADGRTKVPEAEREAAIRLGITGGEPPDGEKPAA